MIEMKTIYIAGQMTGLPDYGRARFADAARDLAERYPDSAIINPADNFSGNISLEYSHYMRMSIHQLLMVDGICMLPGWEKSSGASLEYEIAKNLNLTVIYYESHDAK